MDIVLTYILPFDNFTIQILNAYVKGTRFRHYNKGNRVLFRSATTSLPTEKSNN